MLGSITGGSLTGTGDGTPVAQSSGGPVNTVTAIRRAKTKADAGKADEEKAEDATGNGSGDDNNASQTGTENENALSGSGDDDGTDPVEEGLDPIDDGGNRGGKQEVSESEGGRIPYHQTNTLYAPEGGTTEYDNDYQREKYDRAAADIERILDKMAEKAACTELENARIKELRDVAQNISYGDIHSGVNVRINRINSVDEELVEQFNDIAAPLLAISKQLTRSVIRQFDDYRRGGKQTGLMMGRRLEVRALCRNDGKVFSKNALPNEIPQLSVGLLLDESGSMGCDDRCTYARAAAIILHDFCESLDIPVEHGAALRMCAVQGVQGWNDGRGQGARPLGSDASRRDFRRIYSRGISKGRSRMASRRKDIIYYGKEDTAVQGRDRGNARSRRQFALL